MAPLKGKSSDFGNMKMSHGTKAGEYGSRSKPIFVFRPEIALTQCFVGEHVIPASSPPINVLP
jgi:hypothetical protein